MLHCWYIPITSYHESTQPTAFIVKTILTFVAAGQCSIRIQYDKANVTEYQVCLFWLKFHSISCETCWKWPSNLHFLYYKSTNLELARTNKLDKTNTNNDELYDDVLLQPLYGVIVENMAVLLLVGTKKLHREPSQHDTHLCRKENKLYWKLVEREVILDIDFARVSQVSSGNLSKALNTGHDTPCTVGLLCAFPISQNKG